MTAQVIPIRMLVPRMRGECEGTRMCAAVSCSHHVAWVHVLTRRDLRRLRTTKSSRAAHAAMDRIVARLARMPATCTLYVADQGAHSRAEVADTLGVSRQMVDRIEDIALRKMAKAARGLRREVM